MGILSQPDAKHYLSASDVSPFPPDPFFESEDEEEEKDGDADDKDSDDS
jgi:hypothetical protein